MKLGLVCRPFTFHGGVETATAGLVGELARRGHAVTLLTTRGQRPVDGIRVRRLPVLRQPSLLRLVSFGIAARAAARAGGYDIVQTHERLTGADVYRAGEGTHRGYLEAMGRRARGSPYHRYVIRLETRIFQLKGVRQIVAISARGKAEMERFYATPPDRVTLVYNGVDLARFDPKARLRDRAPARAELGLEAGAWCVLFVGSGFERKGLGPLVEALALRRDPAVRLIVAGKGDRGPYETLAARLDVGGQMIWAGARHDVERLYAAADVVALPARYEPFGNVHLEALASGRPMLTSVHAGGAELIRPGVNGWVVPEVKAGAIAEGLERLHEADPVTLGRAARAAAEPYTYAAQAAAFENLYREIAG
ncbi:MAG TPA: glycosyltransferase family 4 protein [Verrucomicrobiae bacterium]|nr:glycosyltransferase family 4 protein [Verrucomicrobiae bacterium]